jgi:hypothetical protein
MEDVLFPLEDHRALPLLAFAFVELETVTNARLCESGPDKTWGKRRQRTRRRES